MLIAQSLAEPLRLLTRDAKIAAYGDFVIMA
jgi:PIN domain nuclease of toxin-antitoxin system